MDGYRIRITASSTGELDGAYAVIAGGWQGRPRVLLEDRAAYGREAALLSPDDEYEVLSPPSDARLVRAPLCSSCGGSGKIGWTDDEGWEHEAPCETCEGRGETGRATA
ncbi:hypothetical protein RKE29_25290 [Streptomyces sp. B1866]|uniref:hypothetical protein n=1 Tax=Streptomyces sp. B1866 TaxID=3075431 RepID=UPI00288DC12A|nr:hypothetical protein [Streptomyces sp. B1866]MDT3399906.1 hypothetical protein [Streptomyces sp. B1866]